MRQVRGFKLLEFVLVTAVVLFLAAVVIPLPHHHPRKSGEAEVKANLRSIQIALERYAVDHGGVYPLMLYGGHPEDTFVSSRSPVRSEFEGDFDVLIEEGYLSEYPQNPFAKGRKAPITIDPSVLNRDPFVYHMSGTTPYPRVNIWPGRSEQYAVRQVGGPTGQAMFDVSEGQRHIPFPIVMVPDDTGSPSEKDAPKKPSAESHQHWVTPGNFYYYATFSGIGNYASFEIVGSSPQFDKPITPSITGFKLCAYGLPINTGQDVYNVYGDYVERSFNTCGSGPWYTEPDGGAFYCPGPDSRPDGVIIVINSGSDRKRAINQDDTGRDFNANE